LSHISILGKENIQSKAKVLKQSKGIKANSNDAAALKNTLITVLQTDKRFNSIDGDKLFESIWQDH